MLAIDTDTVYPVDHPFQNVSEPQGGILRGPALPMQRAASR